MHVCKIFLDPFKQHLLEMMGISLGLLALILLLLQDFESTCYELLREDFVKELLPIDDQ